MSILESFGLTTQPITVYLDRIRYTVRLGVNSNLLDSVCDRNGNPVLGHLLPEAKKRIEQKAQAQVRAKKIGLPEAVRAQAERVESWSDERDGNDYIFIGYMPGWKSGGDPLGVVHGDTAETMREARRCVLAAMPCDCVDCEAK